MPTSLRHAPAAPLTLALAVLMLDPVGAAAASKLAFEPVSLDFGANAAEIEKKGSGP